MNDPPDFAAAAIRMTREQFVDKYFAELSGLLLASFSVSLTVNTTDKAIPENRLDFSKCGAFFLLQQKQSRHILGRMWDDLNPAPKTNGKPTLASARS